MGDGIIRPGSSQNSILFRQRWPWPGGPAEVGRAILRALVKERAGEVVIVCLGSPNSPGDALGPLVGSILTKNAFHHPVYGTLEHPLDGDNLEPRMAIILRDHPQSKIIAVDAATGHYRTIGQVTVRAGTLWPGLGLGKLMLPLGDISITGVVRARNGFFWGKAVHLLWGGPERWAVTLSEVIAEGIIQGFNRAAF